VEGHSGITEQQGRRRLHRFAPVAGRQCFTAGELGRRRLAVDDVLLFADGQDAILQVVMLHGDEQQRAGTAVLFFDVRDGGNAGRFTADLERLEELEAATSSEERRVGKACKPRWKMKQE